MIRNTENTYGSVAKWLHWLVALCFLIAYIVIYYRIWFLERGDTFYSASLQIHTSVGISILVWAFLRVWWRLTNPRPKLLLVPNWQIKLSGCVHFTLYLFMFAMPISGWFMFGGKINFEIFQLSTFRDTGLGQWLLDLFNTDLDTWEKKWEYFHKEISGKWVLWILIVFHTAAALYHHFFKKNDVLTKILPKKL